MTEKYKANGGTRFFYSENLRNGVTVLAMNGENAYVPIEDLVEFVEAAYHGSELLTGKTRNDS